MIVSYHCRSHADEEQFEERLVALLLTMCGMLIFALLIGIINDLMTEQVSRHRPHGHAMLFSSPPPPPLITRWFLPVVHAG